MRIFSRRSLQLGLIGFFVVLGIEAQPKWRVYTPSNKSFSVELPWNPITRHRNLMGLAPNTGSPFKGSTDDDWYDLSMYIDESSTQFVIHVYRVPFKRSQEEFDLEVRRIMKADSCKNCFTKNEPVVLNGLSGREFIYERDKGSRRVMFINGGNRIYTVSFYTEDRKGISRGPVDRVFSTFQPTP